MAQIFATQRSVKAKTKQNQKRSKLSLKRHPQPTIIHSLASVPCQASLPSSHSHSSFRKMSATKTKPQNLTIDELFGMGSGWLSDNESDPPACGDSGSHTSHSAHSPQCNTSSSLTSPSGSVSAVTGVAGRPGNIGSPDVLLSPPFYLTPPLGEEESDWDRDSGCQTFNTGLLPLNGQRQKNQGSLKKLNSLVNRELSSTSLPKYTAKYTVDSGSGSSEEDDDLPAYTLREPPTSSLNSEREEGGTSKTDSKVPFVVDLDDQESELFPDTFRTHSNTGSSDSQPLGDITNITFPDVFQTTDCPVEKGMHSHSQQSEDSYTALANKSSTHLESNNSSVDPVHTIDLTGDCSIVVLSDNEGVSTSHHSTDHPHNAEGNRRVVGRGKKRIIPPRTLFKGAKELCDVPELRIKRWMCQSKPLLVEIFQRKVYSRRHESFITSAKNRALLQWQISTRLFSKEQVDVITDCLMKCFCYKDMDYFSYVMSVLYPECLVRIIMDFYSLPFDEAEKKMMGLHEDIEDDSDT